MDEKSNNDGNDDVSSSSSSSSSSSKIEPTLIEPSPSKLLSCVLSFAARDHRTGKSATINRLKPSTPAEELFFKERAEQALMRKNKTNNKLKFNNLEIDSLVDRGSALIDMPALANNSSVLMKYTQLENTIICQPQNVNFAGRVFGGFLMVLLSLLLLLLLLLLLILLSSSLFYSLRFRFVNYLYLFQKKTKKNVKSISIVHMI